MWYDSLDTLMSMLMLGMMAAFLRGAYEMSSSHSPAAKKEPQSSRNNLLTSTEIKPGSSLAAINLPELTPQQKAWANKAVQRYAAAQSKKWRRWNEAMFEPR